MKNKWIFWSLFLMCSVVFLMAAFVLETQQSKRLKVDQDNQIQEMTASTEVLELFEKYFEADTVVSEMEHKALTIEDGGVRMLIQSDDIANLSQLRKSSFFSYIEEQYMPGLIDFLSTVDLTNHDAVQYVQSNCSVCINVPENNQKKGYEIQLTCLPIPNLQEVSLDHIFNNQDYFISCHMVNDREKVYMAKTPGYMLYTKRNASENNPAIYYLYMKDEKLTKIRMIMGQDKAVPATSEVFMPLNSVVTEKFHFSTEDLSQLQKIIKSAIDGKITTKHEKINGCLCSLKTEKLKNLSAVQIRNYIELVISL